MSINVADNFSYLGGKPLDARVKYDTIANMVAVPAANLYDGCLAYVTATKKNYQYDSSNTEDETLGKWRELETGGGGGTSDYSDLTNKPSIEGVTLSGNKTASDLGLAKSTDIPSTSDCYKTGDTAFTALADADYVPVYDTSAGAKKKTLWSNIKSVLKTYFDTLYVGTAGTGLSKSSSTMSIKQFASGDMDEVMSPLPSSAPRYNVYSTEEQVVGQWIDGSTIYQKTLQATIPTCTTDGTTVTSSVPTGTTFDKVISIVGTMYHNGKWIPLPSIQSSSVNAFLGNIRFTATPETNIITILNSSSGWSGNTTYITFQYTKTT